MIFTSIVSGVSLITAKTTEHDLGCWLSEFFSKKARNTPYRHSQKISQIYKLILICWHYMAWWRIIIWVASVLLSAFNDILSCEFRGRYGHKLPKQSDLSGQETVDELQPVFSIAPSPGLFFGFCQGGSKQSIS